MSFKSAVDGIWLAKREVARTPILDAPATQTIFTITGGLVRIHGIYGYCGTALDVGAAGTTFLISVNGVAMNAPAYAVAVSAPGDVLLFPLGGYVVLAGPALQSPSAAAITAATGGISIVAGPITGVILLTVGVAPLAAGELCSFRVVYERIDPEAQIQ